MYSTALPGPNFSGLSSGRRPGFGNLTGKNVTAGQNGITTYTAAGPMYGYDGENRLSGGGYEVHFPIQMRC